MSVLPSRFAVSKWKLFCFPILALAFCAFSAGAQVPATVINAQQTLGYGYSNPQSIAVSKNGTVFIADTNNNRIIELFVYAPESGVNQTVTTGNFVLTTPQALALDANGDLFVGDSPTTGGRIIELAGDGNGNLTGAASLVYAGTTLVNPIALAVDSSGTLFIGDYPSSGTGVIYSLAAGGTPQALNITGLSTQFTPAALLRDSSNNLYFVDNSSLSGGVYTVTDTGGAAQPVLTGMFVTNQPSGLARDAAGDLYILSLLGSGSGPNPGQQVIDIPAASPGTPYILPSSGIGTSSGMAFDPNGNLDVLDASDGAVIQLSSANPVNLGNVFVRQTGSQILFNFEFNSSATLGGFRTLTQGDVSTEVVEGTGGNCVNGNHTKGVNAYTPYTCQEYFYGYPSYPGIRSSAIQVKGAGTNILASMPVWQTGFAGVEVTYPLSATTTATGFQQPQAIAISGLNQTVYVADFLAGKVYSTGGLSGTQKTSVSTGTISLSGPSALALDGAGNLFIADFNNSDVIEVPTTTGLAPSVINTGGLLQHPIALTVDYLGNMYIGDAGSGGLNASASDPGYVVKIPVGGAAVKMTTPVSIIFPQALAVDPYTAALLIGDGGDVSDVGKVVQVLTDGTGGSGPVAGVTDPSGLAFDQAENLYILDSIANTITVVAGPQSGVAPYQVPFANTGVTNASAMAISAGGQGFVLANIGSPTNNNLVYLNGNAGALSFGDVQLGTETQKTAYEYNIGNLDLTLKSPYYTTTSNGRFTVERNSTCRNGLMLAPSISCTINVQFAPLFPGESTQQLSVDSDGYNSGVPVLTLQGVGVTGGAVKKRR